MVDDVFTKGTSALKAVKAVRALGCEVVLVLALVDRLQGAPRVVPRERNRELPADLHDPRLRHRCARRRQDRYWLIPLSPPADINPAAVQCAYWFKNSASLEAFVHSSVSHHLIARD